MPTFSMPKTRAYSFTEDFHITFSTGHSGKYLWIPSSVLYRVFQYFMGYDIRRCDIEQILKIEFLGEYRCFALTNRF